MSTGKYTWLERSYDDEDESESKPKSSAAAKDKEEEKVPDSTLPEEIQVCYPGPYLILVACR